MKTEAQIAHQVAAIKRKRKVVEIEGVPYLGPGSMLDNHERHTAGLRRELQAAYQEINRLRAEIEELKR